jgi:hypothetical protein
LTISQVIAEKARNTAIGMYTHQLIISSSIVRRAGLALVICLDLFGHQPGRLDSGGPLASFRASSECM